jgi:hypothetical protein
MLWQDLGNVVVHCPAHVVDDDQHIGNANVVYHCPAHDLDDDPHIDSANVVLIMVLFILWMMINTLTSC